MAPERENIGDVAAFLSEERPRLRRYLLAVVRNPAEAEDLTQETLLRAWRGLPQLRDHGAARAWLHRIANNVLVDRARASRRRPELVPDAEIVDAQATQDAQLLAPGGSPLHQLQQEQMSRCVSDLVDRLPDAQRAVLLLHDVQGLTNPAIAEALTCSVPAVKIRLHRARTRLRRLVDEACEVGSDERGVVVCEPTGGSRL